MKGPPRARILVVDDEAPLARALRDTLAHDGTYDVQAMDDPRKALERLRGERFELLLTDLHMPVMDGIELLREALAIDPDLAVVLMTGAGTLTSAVQAMKSGAMDYILKPFKLNTTLPILVRALEVRSLRIDNRELQALLERQVVELAAANQDLEAFASSVSHDLRSPLRAISGFGSTLQERYAPLLDAQGQHYLGRIQAAAARMDDLIEGLLRLAHVARQPLHLEDLALDVVANRALQDLCEDGVDAGVQVVIGPLPRAACDRALARLAFANLIGNACKFSAGRPGALVQVGSEDGDGGPVLFVRDNGAGFDPDYADQLFQPFRRLHRADEFPGLGLGLSIVQRIVQKHGGRVWAESRPGAGACFRFTLAAATDHADT